MKLLVIQGSYHRDGATVALVRNVIEGFEITHPNNTVKIINLVDANINFCLGCLECGRNNPNMPVGECVQKDDMKEIMQSMLEADRLLLACPVYYFDVTAIMKRFIERTIAFCYYPKDAGPSYRNKPNKNKKAVAIVATGCPAPLNWLSLMTLHPLFLLRTVLKEAGFGTRKYLSASSVPVQLKGFEKRAHDLGAWLGK